MSEKHFEQSMNSKKHVQSELDNSGISNLSEWQKAIDLGTPLDGEKGINFEQYNFDELFAYLNCGKEVSDKEKIEKFIKSQDSIERLEILRLMSLDDAINSIHYYSATEAPFRYLENRLDFYQKFIQGKAIIRQTESEWDPKKDEYIQVEKKYQIDASSASPETVRLGLLRDIEFAAMIGSPELGIYKIVSKRLNEKGVSNAHMPELKGYHSYIHEGSIGYTYPFLRKLYEKARKQVDKRIGDKKIDEQVVEHRSVILASNWLEEAMNYNSPGRGPESPYVGSLDEAIAWGRLGPQVKKQLLGMRRKIQGIDLHNIGRFIGKAGDNRYGYEKKRLDKEVELLEDFIQDDQSYDASFLLLKNEDGTDKKIKGKEAAETMTSQKNSEAVQRAKLWFDRETAKINHWFEKSKTKIAGYDIPEEERDSINLSVQDRYNKKVGDLQQEYQGEIARLENRTPEELLEVFKERQVIVNKRFEKRKSLAQKALDLHFRFNHEGRDYGSKPFDQIDWVNSAPFGVIKRAHRALSAGVDEQTIMMRALAEVNGESANDQNPEKFILKILKSGRAYKVIQNFEKFSGITQDQHLNILLAIIGSGAGRYAVESLNKFTGITPNDHLRIVQALNGLNAGETVITNFDKFGGIKPEEKRDVLIGAIRGGGGYQFAQNFEEFSDVFSEKDHPEVVQELSKAGAGGTVIDNFQKFSGIPVEQHRQMVLDAIKGGGSSQVIQNLEKFRGVTEKDHRDIVLEIIKSGGGYYLNGYYGNNLDKFKGLEEGLRQVIKAGKYEAFPHVLEAGFTIEEITRFPFLISPLVTKK